MTDIFVDDEEILSSEPTASPSAEQLKIKFNTVNLPSKGKLGYPESVKYRDIMVRDEKILSTATLEDYEVILNEILESLLENPSFFRNITVADRDYMLMWIWANNYSTIKKFNVRCPVCDNNENLEVDLTKLEVEEISDDYEHPFEMEISNGETIKVRLATVGDEQITRKFLKANKDYNYTDVLLACTIEFDKKMPLKQKLAYMEEHMKGRDMGLVRAFHRHFKYGIDDEIDHTCSACGEVTPFTVPFSFDFFMPTLQDDFEKMLRSNKVSKNSAK